MSLFLSFKHMKESPCFVPGEGTDGHLTWFGQWYKSRSYMLLHMEAAVSLCAVPQAASLPQGSRDYGSLCQNEASMILGSCIADEENSSDNTVWVFRIYKEHTSLCQHTDIESVFCYFSVILPNVYLRFRHHPYSVNTAQRSPLPHCC